VKTEQTEPKLHPTAIPMAISGNIYAYASCNCCCCCCYCCCCCWDSVCPFHYNIVHTPRCT